ncbi:tlde1 domain-containing protein [Shinella sp.]|uniref:tlde1 domain-containing protein n=1 Tax=Shinella sp. TaxID=1870904 RepID=UPI0040350478
MASVYESARSASKSRRVRSGGILLSALLACGVIAGSAWAVVSTLSAMQDAASSLSEGKKAIAASLHGKPVVTDRNRVERTVKIAKFSRLSQPSESERRQRQLTAEAVQVAHQRRISIQLASAVKREKAKAALIEAAIARAERSVEQEKAITGQPTMVTALLPDESARKDIQPFGLVMQKPEIDEESILSEIPLPEAKPALETVTIERKPVEEKPVARTKREKQDDKEDVAIAKPERSLFNDFFKSKGSGGTGWPGKGTRVAIYDVSNATVYMPDGTKLRAHSGIGKMRDNPDYEHIKMTGPTPAGIYRLKMRERRFHGVEAIRMTSIDGRDPKNRTGLLTHTNLLRGQKGSHGCVAFQNYEPFLNAFKRGHINMMVVVPELPSSRTRLAALYRKAGA